MDGIALLVGLGNPGQRYAATRHNAGFWFLDAVLAQSGAALRSEDRFNTALARLDLAGRRLWVMAPTTFMNLSGDAVAPFCRYYDVPTRNVLVVCDDHDLPWGRLRLRPKGSTAGHKGLASITNRLGEDGYPRLRIGIRPSQPLRDLADYVLAPFWGEGRDLADPMIALAADAVEAALEDGLAEAMNRFNGRDLANTE